MNVRKNMAAFLLVACFLSFTLGVFTGAYNSTDAHVHGWSKWEGTNTLYRMWNGQPATEQLRRCTNCGFIQIEVH